MNSDSESLQNQLFRWLLAETALTSDDTSVECKENNGVENLTAKTTDLNSREEQLEWTPQTFQLGEIPTVQERFQAVLKRRLQIQIQNHPPLFPWETQVKEYPDYADNPSVSLVPAWGWAQAQASLNLPIDLPERVFRQLLEKCQALVTSSLPLGAKLVQAVESLFPNDPHTINDLAGLVLRTPYRSAASSLEVIPNLDSDYSELQPRQQMAVSLLAAKQLLDNLTLTISATNPVIERQWLSSAGAIALRVEYQSQGSLSQLCVRGNLPTKGSLKVVGNGTQAMAQSSAPGSLSLEITDNANASQPRQPYTLEVNLTEIDEKPLTFLILPTL
ncbi:PatU [Calothrix sp. UHCC 0171]|uniref:PatU n=1 Tax=Calothrix sp. UHCC 0171 TaxID=3110245 RepID=UPI002B20EA82|nr:PatU [Calothrix sp. UHCC 0171]MEA5571856.1 PatU [Calothrix sp. UHCC 0171]